MRLAEFTFHPELDGLAFVGLWSQLGPYAVPLEQQARWIAYSWSGAIPAPDRAALEQGLRDCEEHAHHVGYREQHEMAIRFGRLAQVDPEGLDDPELAAVLPHATLTADTFRLVGPDADPTARARVLRDFRCYAPPAVRKQVEARFGHISRPAGDPECLDGK
jgi:dimethylaniline monooxygenase (N-oxide forming)